MKKFLLTMIVTMLSFVGAWGQDSPQVIEKVLFVGENITISSSDVHWTTTQANISFSDLTVKSGDEEYVNAVVEWGNSIKLTGLKKTTTPATITFTAINEEYGTGNVLETVECTAYIEVKEPECTITITPTPNPSMALNSNATYYYTASWKKGETPITDTWAVSTSAFSSNNDIVKCTDNGNIYLEAVAGGEATITVRSTFGTLEATESFVVTVVDPSMAISIDASDVSVAYGYSKTIDVQLNPTTATNFTSAVSNISGVTCTKVGDIEDGMFQLKIDASDLSAEATGTITITAGSVTKTINLSVTEPIALNSITLAPDEDQTVIKGDKFDVSVGFNPANAANTTINWTYDSDIISLENKKVTGLKRGSTILTATPADTHAEAKSINVNVKEYFEGTLDVPASTRVGVVGGMATLNITNGATESDYTVVYSSSDPSVLEVNATTGALNPVAAGTATITTTLTPTTSGEANGFITTSFESGEITVGDVITGEWSGSIDKVEFALGEQYAQTEGFPQVTWSETVAGATTQYSIVSDDQTIVDGRFIITNNVITSMDIYAFKAGSTNVSVKAEYGYYDTNSVWTPIATTTLGPVEVTVATVEGEFTVKPSADFRLEIHDNAGLGKTSSIVASWADGKAPAFLHEETGDDAVTVGWDYKAGAIAGINIKPKALGTATVTVKSTWTANMPYGYPTATEEKSVTFNVTVYDKTHVTSLTAPANQDVQQGKANEIDVLFAPFTAEFQDPTSDNGKVTVSYKMDNGSKFYPTLVLNVADDAPIGSTATITLTPKEGSSAEAKTFTVTVVKPELPVSDIKPKTVYHVGETYESQLTMGDDLVLGDDYTKEFIVSDNNAKDGGEAISLDPATGKIVALKVGTANITTVFTPTSSEKGAKYAEWRREMPIIVEPGKIACTIAATDNGDGTWNTAVKGTTLNGETSEFDAYTVKYSLEGAPSGVTINENTGVVSGVPTSSATQFAVVATLTPNDETNYVGSVSKAAILVEGTASNGVILTKHYVKDENGDDTDVVDYIEVNVPTPGAFGEHLSDNPTITSTDGTTLADLIAAENVKLTGLLANSDVQELVYLIGGVTGAGNHGNCNILDMGEAKMTEAITCIDGKCSLVGGYTVSVDGGGNETKTQSQKTMIGAESIVLPQPATGVPGGTILPEGTNGLFSAWFTRSENELQSFTIPEGWTETADNFSFNGDGETAFQHLTELKLPNSLEKIGAYSFSDIQVRTLYMPKNLKYIGKYAFSPASKLEDIYFTGDGKDLKYVHVAAFSTQSQMCNNTVADNDKNGQHMPTIDRSRYSNGGVLGCIMHFPKGCDAEYTDVTREYTIIDTSEESGRVYDKGNYVIIPYGGDQENPDWEWTSIFQKNVRDNVSTPYKITTLTVDGAFPDDTYGYSFIWPSQAQLESGYAIANAGYLWNTQPMSLAQLDPENGVDKRGLYQFLVAMGNAPTDKEEWPFMYEQEKWYTIALPFDMSIADIKKVFGPKTQVCRFSTVIRDVTNEEDKVLRLEFRNSVMHEGDGRPEDIEYSDGEDDQYGIRHHWPYMIKPSGFVKDEIDPSIRFNEETGERVYSGFKTIPGILHEEKVTAVLKDRETEVGKDYYFRPILMEGKLKKNSYVLVNKDNEHQYAFYKGVKGAGADSEGRPNYTDGGKANANTAYVQIDHGFNDFDDFFPASSAGQAKVRFASFFGGFIDEEEATKIDRIEIVCGDEKVADDKIYTLSGVRVSGSSLAPGIYIKNGKKFIVR